MSVTFWTLTKGKPRIKWANEACFYPLQNFRTMPDAVLYHCRSNPNLFQEATKFYILWMEQWMGSDAFKYKFAKVKKYDGMPMDGVKFLLRCKGWSYKKTLLHLTAMRYPEELYPVVTRFYNERPVDLSAESLFAHFQRVHASYALGSAHGLLPYGAATVTYDLVHKRLKEDRMASVHNYFRP